ncbi:PREDICTED: protein COBRA-like [Fragaria vesca subsp. vesca]
MSFIFLPTIKSISLSTTSFAVLLLFRLSFTSVSSTEAYDPVDPIGHITIKWDIMNWTPDGYVAVVKINNFQKYRNIQAPGWSLRWTWRKEEVIWSMVGEKPKEKGDCSRFKGSNPRSCEKNPTIVDAMPSTPYNQQIANCCKGGVLGSLVQDPANSVAAFQLTVGRAETTNRTVRLPKDFTLSAPGPNYSCGRATIVKPTRFFTPDLRRMTTTFMTWNVTCTCSQYAVQQVPTCCVSLSSFYKNTTIPCSTCSCSCQNNSNKCVELHSSSVVPVSDKSYVPVVQCTSHMCPIQISWQVTKDHKQYWLVKLKITNFNYKMNYLDWNLVIQHPNFDNLTRILRFNYKSLTPYAGINDTAMLWGVKFYNNILMQAGPLGTVESELIFQKHGINSNLSKDWAFPQRVYFNGDNCIMPSADAYLVLPK